MEILVAVNLGKFKSVIKDFYFPLFLFFLYSPCDGDSGDPDPGVLFRIGRAELTSQAERTS